MFKYFKASIPFSSGTGIYNPSDKDPGKAPTEVVDSWIDAGYCIEVEAPPKIKIEIQNVEAPNKPIEEQLPVEDTNTPDESKTTEIEETEKPNDDFEGMSYPNLIKLAKEKGIESKKKDEIIKALRGE